MNKTSPVAIVYIVCAHGAVAQTTPQQPPATTTLEPVTVTGQTEQGNNTATTSATRIDVPIKDIPQSIQVVPRELLGERGVTRIGQVAETVSGVLTEAAYGNNNTTFFNIRGFSTSNGLRDGFLDYGYHAPRDIQAIERIEVIKGPTGVLYGASNSVGGYINTVSKRPLREGGAEVGLTLGSYGLARPTLDWNQPLAADGSLRARLNVAYETNDTFRDFSGYKSYSVAPAVAWDLTPATTVTALLEVNQLDLKRYDFGIPNLPFAAQLDRKRYFGVAEDNGKSNAYSATTVVDHKVGTNWSYRLGLHATYSKQDATYSFPDTSTYAGGPLLDFYFYPGFYDNSKVYSVQNELVGSFSTGTLKHRLLLGVEWSRIDSFFRGDDTFFYQLDLFDPAVAPIFSDSLGGTTPTQTKSDSTGVYVQDLVEVLAGVKLLAGVRADRFDTTVVRAGAQSGAAEDSKLSPRVGVVWQPVRDTSLYTSWTRSFSVVTGTSASGAAFEPASARQVELGIKQDFADQRISATLAVFDLVRSGVLTRDLANPMFRVQSGEQRSRGVEFDIGGAPVTGWKLNGSYAYIDAEVTRDNSLPVGDALQDAPRHSGSLWSTYQLQSGAWQGFGFGGGALYVCKREATLPNSFKLAGYTRVDASLFYRRQHWKLQLNSINVFDKRYFTGGSAGVFGTTVNPSTPRSLQASFIYGF